MEKEQILEIEKALAYGKSVEEVAEHEGVDVSVIQQIQTDYAKDIEDEKAYLKEMSYMG